LPSWFSTQESQTNDKGALQKNSDVDGIDVVMDDVKDQGDSNIDLAKESLTSLLDDSRVPESVRNVLQDDYKQLRVMLDKLENLHFI